MASSRPLPWWQELLKGPAGVVGAMAALGFVVLSPGDRVRAVEQRVVGLEVRQATRDSAQDLRALVVERKVDSVLRRVAVDLQGLLLAQCLVTKDRAVFAQLECSRRLGR